MTISRFNEQDEQVALSKTKKEVQTNTMGKQAVSSKQHKCVED